MGSSAGAPDPSAPDPVVTARRRVTAAVIVLAKRASLPGVLRSSAERELGAALDAWWEAKERESSGSLL